MKLSKETLEVCLSLFRGLAVRVEEDACEEDFPKMRNAFKEIRAALKIYEEQKSDESKTG